MNRKFAFAVAATLLTLNLGFAARQVVSEQLRLGLAADSPGNATHGPASARHEAGL